MEAGLYVITTDVPPMGRTHLDVARAAVAGGARVIQLREKRETVDILEIARRLRELTRQAGVTFIINDRVDVALAADADGVHLGQADMVLSAARSLLGDGKLVGMTVSNLRQAIEAERQGADYLGVSPIFATPSKEDAGQPIGCGILAEIRKQVRVPLTAIGGINLENVEEVIRSGADLVAVISAVAAAPDMELAVRELADRISMIAKSERRGSVKSQGSWVRSK